MEGAPGDRRPNPGVVFPGHELGSDPVAIRDFVQAADDLGYERLIAYDHVLGFQGADRKDRGFYEETFEFHEPLTLFSHLAAVTSRLRFTTGILVLPMRQTVLVAKQAAEVAILSGSRLDLGVGLGSAPAEFEAMGVTRRRRGARIDEQIELLRELWSHPLVDFDGDFHRVDRAAMLPRPPQPIPILVGGWGEPAYRRAVRLADGFVLGASGPQFHHAARSIRDLLAEAGRPPAEFALHSMIDFGLGPGRLEKELDLWARDRAASVSLRTTDRDAVMFGAPRPGFRTPGQHIGALEQFATLFA
jgi:probable F420-dependent oxidoreductase